MEIKNFTKEDAKILYYVLFNALKAVKHRLRQRNKMPEKVVMSHEEQKKFLETMIENLIKEVKKKYPEFHAQKWIKNPLRKR